MGDEHPEWEMKIVRDGTGQSHHGEDSGDDEDQFDWGIYSATQMSYPPRFRLEG